MKKLLATLLASTMALTTIGGLVACGGGNEGGGSQDVNIPMPALPTDALTLTIWAPDGAITVYTEMVDAFKAENPGAANWTVTFEGKGEGDAASAVRTDPKTGPNMYFLASDQVTKNAENAALQPLPTEMVKQVKERDIAGTIDPMHKDGMYYAFPNANSNGYFLIYDTNYYTAEDVKSLDTMVTKATADGKKILFDYGNGFYNPTFFFGMGLGLGDTASGDKVTIDSTKGYEAGKTYVKYFGTGASGVFAIPSGNNAVAEGFRAGDVVAGVMGTWVNENNALYDMADGTAGWSRDRIGFTQLPKFTDTTGKSYQMGSFMGAKYMGVNPAKSEKEIAASLYIANYFNTKENQLKRFEATGDAPSNMEATADSKVSSDPMLVALAAQNNAGGHMQQDTPAKFWDALGAFGNNIYDGTTTAANIKDAVDSLAASLRLEA
ncbi:MAG: extracellular solute-binding protein [Clostridiales bacterium]|nr:extracellular solute-binding protein [Clostridiales bacterium]